MKKNKRVLWHLCALFFALTLWPLKAQSACYLGANNDVVCERKPGQERAQGDDRTGHDFGFDIPSWFIPGFFDPKPGEGTEGMYTPPEDTTASGSAGSGDSGMSAGSMSCDGSDPVNKAKQIVKAREGTGGFVAYADTKANPANCPTSNCLTVGYGHLVQPGEKWKNPGDPITKEEADELFEKDIKARLDASKAQIDEAGICDGCFLTALISVNYQLGTAWNTKVFPDSWQLIVKGDYNQAADNIMKSKWAEQTANRAREFATALRMLPPKSTMGCSGQPSDSGSLNGSPGAQSCEEMSKAIEEQSEWAKANSNAPNLDSQLAELDALRGQFAVKCGNEGTGISIGGGVSGGGSSGGGSSGGGVVIGGGGSAGGGAACVASGTATGNFHIENGQIIDPAGKVFLARGINIGPEDMDVPDRILALFPGINFIRLADASLQGGNPAAYQSFINAMTSQGVVVEIEHHPWPIPRAYTGAQLEQESAMYASLAAAFKDNPYVWFGTMNEPQSDYGPGEVIISQQQAATYKAIRDAGNNNIIMMEAGVGAGNPGTVGAGFGMTPETYASMTNIVWDNHFYPWMVPGMSSDQATVNAALAGSVEGGQGIAAAQTIQSADGIVPVIIGEFGDSSDGSIFDSNGDQVVQAVLDNGVGYAAWHWNDLSGTGADALTYGDDSLRPLGEKIAADIAASSTNTGLPENCTVAPSTGCGGATGGTAPSGSTAAPQGNAATGGWEEDSVGGQSYVRLLPANYDPSKSYPLVLFLHQLANSSQIPAQIDPWFNTPGFREKYPAIVIAPRCENSSAEINWGGVTAATQSCDTNAFAAVQKTMQEYNVDTSRVYVTGDSMGGIGSWHFILKYTDTFAAAMPLAGANYAADPAAAAAQLANKPIWAIHGAGDTQVPLDWDRQVYNMMKTQGGIMKYTEDPSLGHDVWDTYYPQDQVWQWLFAQQLGATTSSGGTGGSTTTGGSSAAPCPGGASPPVSVPSSGGLGNGGSGGSAGGGGGAPPVVGGGFGKPSPPLTSGALGGWETDSYAGMTYYRLLPAEYDPTKGYPVILYLHFLGGADYAQPDADNWFNNPEFRSQYPAVIIAPRCENSNEQINWGGVTGEPSCGADAYEVLMHTVETYSIDPSRIYVTGPSMGGIGSWSMAIWHPDTFAAVIPMAGAIYDTDPNVAAEKLRNVPIWAFHGAEDTQVPIGWDRTMYSLLGNGQGNMFYTEDQGVGHGGWDAHYHDMNLWNWVFSQTKL